MISALKITADKMAEVGECRCMTSSAFNQGSVPANSAGMMAKYFATPLEMEKVVSAPRVIRSCLPISTTSSALSGRCPGGEIYGFLGRNGAGKTTTIRMLLGLVRPSAGSISILGSAFGDDRKGVLSRIGYLVESAAAYPNLTVRKNLHIQRRLTGAPPAAMEEVIDLLKLGEYVNRRAGRLSLGNKQRLSLARALVHRPELLILDEPANGLDPAGIVEIRALLRRLALSCAARWAAARLKGEDAARD
jgi:ABC-type Na+ transport system ATPase subunit NatA